MLSVYSQIIFTKNVWGFVKGLIERSAWNGMDNFFNDLINALQSEYCIPPAKSKSRRTKSGETPYEHIYTHVSTFMIIYDL